MDLEAYQRLKERDPTAAIGMLLGEVVPNPHPSGASRLARMIAAQAWCEQATQHKVIDSELAEAFATILDRYIEALNWCGGSADFNPGGQAYEGWRLICAPLVAETGNLEVLP